MERRNGGGARGGSTSAAAGVDDVLARSATFSATRPMGGVHAHFGADAEANPAAARVSSDPPGVIGMSTNADVAAELSDIE